MVSPSTLNPIVRVPAASSHGPLSKLPLASDFLGSEALGLGFRASGLGLGLGPQTLDPDLGVGFRSLGSGFGDSVFEPWAFGCHFFSGAFCGA